MATVAPFPPFQISESPASLPISERFICVRACVTLFASFTNAMEERMRTDTLNPQDFSWATFLPTNHRAANDDAYGPQYPSGSPLPAPVSNSTPLGFARTADATRTGKHANE